MLFSTQELKDLNQDLNNKLTFILPKKISALNITNNIEGTTNKGFKNYRLDLEYNNKKFTLDYGLKITLRTISEKRFWFFQKEKRILTELEVVYKIAEGNNIHSSIIQELLKVKQQGLTTRQLIQELKKYSLLRLADKLATEIKIFIFRL